MKSVLKAINIFAYSHCTLPARLTQEAIHINLQQNIAGSYQTYNNLLIGIDYLSIVAKYSKCYLCKLPMAKNLIRSIHGMSKMDMLVHQMKALMFAEVPSKLRALKWIGKYFKYNHQNMYSSLSLLFSCPSDSTQSIQAVKFMGAIECVTLGFQLHNAIQTNFRPNTIVNLGLKVLKKVIKDKYLVLAGDYLHIRGSVLAGETQLLETSKLLAKMEIQLCMYVQLKEQLRRKIEKEGYGTVKVEEIHEIARMKAKQMVNALKGMEAITQQGQKQVMKNREEIFQTVGLLVLFRRQLEDFIFNFKKVVDKFVECKMSNTSTDDFTLSHYLFYQSAKKTTLRIDLAYLNTVQMMSKEIRLIEEYIQSLVGKQQYNRIDKMLRYVMMMHM